MSVYLLKTIKVFSLKFKCLVFVQYSIGYRLKIICKSLDSVFFFFFFYTCNLYFGVLGYFNQFYENAFLYESGAIRNNIWIDGCGLWLWLPSNNFGQTYHFGCWNCVQMSVNTCVTVSGEQKGPLFALGMLPGKIQWNHVFVREQNIFKG